jgi:predicted PurR-regulated permease PerM
MSVGAEVTTPGTWLLMAITAVVFYLCWTIVAPFVSALTWAVALCVVLSPLRRRLIRKLHPTAIAVIMLGLVVAVVALFLYLISQRLIQEALRAQELFQNLMRSEIWQHWMGSAWTWVQSQIDLSSITQDIIKNLAPAFGKSAIGLSRTFLSLIFFFFFVRDQERVIEAVRQFLPLTQSETEYAFGRATATVQGAVIGRIGIGVLQGLLGGVAFALTGIPGPLFWSIVMAALSILPVVGAFVVWIPAALILLSSGQWLRGLFIVAWGIGVIHPVDNILYPIVVGPRVGLHPTVLLIAFLGGLIVFGPPGLILGPLVVTVAMVLADIWHARSKGQ